MKNLKPIEAFALNEAKNKYGNEFALTDKITKDLIDEFVKKLKNLPDFDIEKADDRAVDSEFNLAYNALYAVADYVQALKIYISTRNHWDDDKEIQDKFADVLAEKQNAMKFIKQMK